MKKVLNLTLALCSICIQDVAYAQKKLTQEYLPYANPPVVEAYNRTLPFAWAGGLNNPHPNLVDLNGDGVNDLAIFDYSRYGTVRTFLNESAVPGNPKYVYHPEYQSNFPDMFEYMKLADYNRDGILDLFHRGAGGVGVYKGYYKGSGAQKTLAFTFYRELRYATKNNGTVNCYVGPGDLPSIIDIDKDGDLDVISYDVNGALIGYYRNCQKEDGLPADSMRMCFMDECWGKSQQYYERKLILGINCSQTGTTCSKDNGQAKTTHSGNTICLLDYDGDGDYDMLNGNISFADIQFLRNGKANYSSGKDSFVSQDTIWSSNGKALNIANMPAAFWLDIDNDGNNDLLFSANMRNTENHKCLVYYRNQGTNASPNYNYVTDSLFVGDMIDMGQASYPVVYDYNKDGKPDIFISSDGFYQPSAGKLRARIHYYENTSTGSTTSFKLMNDDFMNYWANNATGVKLAFGDLDNDGIDDMLMGKNDGGITYFKNNAASNNVTPSYGFPVQLNDQFGTMDVGDYATPTIFDVDADGKNDIVSGSQLGKLFYFRNGGGTPVPTFVRVTDTLGGVFIEEEEGNVKTSYTTPFIGKIDNTGKTQLLIGAFGGILYRYDGIGGGNTKGYKLLDSMYCYINVRDRSTPFVADIDNDGRMEMLVGCNTGGVMLYKQYFNVGVNDITSKVGNVVVYPNPANNIVTIAWDKGFAAQGLKVTLVSVTGQVVAQKDVIADAENTDIDVTALAQGVYYCIVRNSNGAQSVTPVSVVK